MYKHVFMSYLCDYVNYVTRYMESFLEEHYFDYFMLRKEFENHTKHTFIKNVLYRIHKLDVILNYGVPGGQILWWLVLLNFVSLSNGKQLIQLSSEAATAEELLEQKGPKCCPCECLWLLLTPSLRRPGWSPKMFLGQPSLQQGNSVLPTLTFTSLLALKNLSAVTCKSVSDTKKINRLSFNLGLARCNLWGH